MKCYYSGTIAIKPTGVSPEDVHLVKDLPHADGGIGCVIFDFSERRQKYAYAEKYNEIIVLHLKNNRRTRILHRNSMMF